MMNYQNPAETRQTHCSCGAPFGAEDNFCAYCGAKRETVIRPPVSDSMRQDPNPVYPADIPEQKNYGQTLPLDLGADPMPTLFVQTSGQTVTLTDGNFIIGRERAHCALALQEKSVSRTHAVILKEGVTWYLCDLGSTNGTFLNRTRIQPQVKTPLNNGDVIQLGGREVLRFQQESASTGW